jgi:hypothetical protein
MGPLLIKRAHFKTKWNKIFYSNKKLAMPKQLNYDRRRFIGAAAITMAAGPLFMIGSADAQPREVKPASASPARQRTNASFDTIKQVDAGVLNIGYAEAGPANEKVVILLHGWPYDIHSYIDVSGLLAAKGYQINCQKKHRPS